MTECQKCHEDKTDVAINGVFVLCEKCENQVHEFIVFDQRNTNR